MEELFPLFFLVLRVFVGFVLGRVTKTAPTKGNSSKQRRQDRFSANSANLHEANLYEVFSQTHHSGGGSSYDGGSCGGDFDGGGGFDGGGCDGGGF